MTKALFLQQLIDKKESWQFSMPVFKEQVIQLQLSKGTIYMGTLRFFVESNVLFECYIESLKGIVEPSNPYLAMTVPVVEYRVNTAALREGYTYEDRLTFYYSGGKTAIDFQIYIESQIEEHMVKILPEQVKYNLKRKKKENITIQSTKRSYHFDEIIQMDIENHTLEPVRLLIECNDESISPKITEVYLNDKWSQEWYVKKTLVSRWFGKHEFKNKPFRNIEFSVFINNKKTSDLTPELAISVKENYDTETMIHSKKQYYITKLAIYQSYIDYLINHHSKKTNSVIMDLIKGCLNYDQQDFDLRLFYIWLLIETGEIKTAQREVDFIQKYKDYFEEIEAFSLVTLFQKILKKETIADIQDLNTKVSNTKVSTSRLFDHKLSSYKWIEFLVIGRYTQIRNKRYEYYMKIYEQGYKSSFILAEVTSLLNQMPVMPRETDSLYIACIHWSLNKNIMSHSWLNKLDRHYYQLENNPNMNSHLAWELYKLKYSKNFLRLFCQLSIKEERYDLNAYEGYKSALKDRIYIQDLDMHYLYASWFTQEDINLELLKHFTKTSHLDVSIREYIYLSIVRKRLEYSTLFRRILPEIIFYLEKTTTYNDRFINLTSLLIEDLIKDYSHVVTNMMTRNHIYSIYKSDEGKHIIKMIFNTIIFESSKESLRNNQIAMNILNTIGFEGLMVIYNQDQRIIKLYDRIINDGIQLDNKMSLFLDNHAYSLRFSNEPHLLRFLKGVLIDTFIPHVANEFFELEPDEKKQVSQMFFYYVSKQIVMAHESVECKLFEEMYNYYVESIDKPVWLLLALVKGLDINDTNMVIRVRKLYEDGKKHDIIVPWFNQDILQQEQEIVYYLAHPDDMVFIYFRYMEDVVYQQVLMTHIAFGVFIVDIKLFYGEVLEYYIKVHETNGYQYIPHSHILKKDFIGNESIYIENEFSVEYRIDNISLSYELNDEKSAKVFIDEQLRFDNGVRRLLRL